MRRWARSQARTPTGAAWLAMWRLVDDGGFHLRFGGGQEVTIDGAGRHIWSPHLSAAETAVITGYLYGVIFGLAFYLQGATCLHASAIAVDEKALLFVGDAGYGKSSTAATLVKQGFPLITDDLAVLDPPANSVGIPSAFPAIRLRSAMATLLLGREHALPLLAGDADKVLFQLVETGQFYEGRAPLSAVYLLGRQGRHSNGLLIHPVAQRDAVLALSQFGYLPTLMEKRMRRAEFEMLSAVVKTIPVFQLPALPDPAGLPQLCQAIVEHGSSL